MYAKATLAAFAALYILLAGPVTAYWRMSCMGVVGRGRIDPIVSPNEVSAHLHTFKGGSGK
jgi:hypothetical protein